MSRIVFVSGGARSGKSTFGEKYIAEAVGKVGYIATAKVTDQEMVDRIRKHRESRPSEWPTFERYQDMKRLFDDEVFSGCDGYILDCVTILTTNQMFETQEDYEAMPADRISEIEASIIEDLMDLLEWVRKENKMLVLVTNEVGLGLVPAYPLGRIFRDIAGRINQRLAAEADEAYFMVSGLPLTLKGPS